MASAAAGIAVAQFLVMVPIHHCEFRVGLKSKFDFLDSEKLYGNRFFGLFFVKYLILFGPAEKCPELPLEQLVVG